MTLFHLWDLPGDVLAAPESASGLDRCNLSLSLSHQQYVLPYCSSCLWYIWNSNHILEAHACFLVSLCLLFASVGQASARPIASLPWTLFTSLLTHRLVLLCIDAHCFIFWALPGHVLAAPESALGLERCNTSLSLSLSARLAGMSCNLSIYLFIPNS